MFWIIHIYKGVYAEQMGPFDEETLKAKLEEVYDEDDTFLVIAIKNGAPVVDTYFLAS